MPGRHPSHAVAARVRRPRELWYADAPGSRPSDASSTPYDIAPSLRVGGALLTPHSIGSMGGSDAEFWGSPSMGSSRPQSVNQPPAADASASADARYGDVLAHNRQRQPSIDMRNLSGMSHGSLYNAFYSGLDVSAAASHSSLARSGPQSVASGAMPVGTPTPRTGMHSGSVRLTMGPRPRAADSAADSAEGLLCVPCTTPHASCEHYRTSTAVRQTLCISAKTLPAYSHGEDVCADVFSGCSKHAQKHLAGAQVKQMVNAPSQTRVRPCPARTQRRNRERAPDQTRHASATSTPLQMSAPAH